MDSDTKEFVAERAGGVCEYCRISGEFFTLAFQVEHIIARKHHGTDEIDNLAYACDRCNQHKGANIAGRDVARTGELVRLFHPRTDEWSEHFEQLESGRIEGVTDVGRVSVDVLNMNAPSRVELRREIVLLRSEPNQ